jgi:hypothetical protein
MRKMGEWLKAMQEEMKTLHENHTFELVKLPKSKRELKNKWVLRLKIDENFSQPKYKPRFVVKGFGHKQGINF